ncbi:MAG: TolC family protein [Aquificota bacterium]|nr:TolC family protein [Aquificota bacterium]
MARSLKRAWGLLLTLLCFSFSITLEEAERKALERNADLRVGRLEIGRRSEEARRAFGELLPRLDFELSLNFSRRLSFTLPGVPPFPPQEFTFQKEIYPKATLLLRQDIFNPVSIRDYEIRKILEKAQVYSLKEKRLDVLYRVREAYINALKAKALIALYRKQIDRVKAHLRDVEELYKEGIVPFKDLLETRVRLMEVEEKVISAEAEYAKALSHLSYLVGEEVKDLEDIDPDSVGDLSLKPPEDLKRTALRSRPVLLFYRELIRSREKALDLARSLFYPVLTAEGFLQYTEESDVFPKTRYLISLALRWNVFSGLKRLRTLEIAKIEKIQETERLRDLEKRVILEVETALEDIRSARARVKLAEAMVEEAREHLRIALEKYKAGLGTNREVLDAESYLTRAEQILRINTYDLILRMFKLRRSVGYEE